MKNVREVALNIINKVLNEGAYSNLILNETIQTIRLNEKDVGLLTELVYGTIQYKTTLDYFLAHFIGEKKIKNEVRNILRMAVYQMVYLDKIPNHAIINEAVNLTKRKYEGKSGFVNAVLRNITRQGVPSLDEIKDEKERLSVETSHPLWLVKMWSKQYDLSTAKKVCELNNIKPYQYARLNLYKDKKENILNRLDKLNIDYELTQIDEGIYLKNENIANTSLFKSGYVNIQDLSSMLVAKVLSPKQGDKVIDVCSAPGGKSTHIAELMKDSGEVIACDIYEHKIKLIEYNKRRLGLKSVQPTLIDATQLTKVFDEGSFDRVLVDVPCSGLGVIRRKPEIKYNKKPTDLDEIIKLQKEIVDESIKLVKKDGTLVYSTCTINKKENEKMVEYILENYPEFELNSAPFEKLNLGNKGYVQLINQIKGADIFFIACFIKKS
ncbi:16S rRNA (cytosine(967)-C(5))-methyltransferase RsmB [Mycoplasmatota bacterium]|nr:16S rRNA (cytosine(967)-C(5))-methyltransferase RsmB [Mycoplasmatota bacterium]